MEPLPGPRQLREVALELATRIAHVAVRYQLIDKALRVWGEKALGIPRDAQPTSKRSTALYQPYGTDTPVGNLHRGRHDRYSVPRSSQRHCSVRRRALQQHARPEMSNRASSFEPIARCETATK